jgi:hypothetical protein
MAFAWRISRTQLKKNEFELTLRNPYALYERRYIDPDSVIQNISGELAALSERLRSNEHRWKQLKPTDSSANWPKEKLSKLANQVKREVIVEPDRDYPILAMAWYAKGLYVKHVKKGRDIQATKLYSVKAGDFVYNRLFAWKGSFAEVSAECDGAFVSNEFPFELDREQLAPGYLWAYFAQPALWQQIEGLSTGTTSTSRLRLKEQKLRQFWIPVPPKPVQEQISLLWRDTLLVEGSIEELAKQSTDLAPSVFERVVAPISDDK